MSVANRKATILKEWNKLRDTTVQILRRLEGGFRNRNNDPTETIGYLKEVAMYIENSKLSIRNADGSIASILDEREADKIILEIEAFIEKLKTYQTTYPARDAGGAGGAGGRRNKRSSRKTSNRNRRSTRRNRRL